MLPSSFLVDQLWFLSYIICSMGNFVHSYGSSKNSEMTGVGNGKNVSKKCVVPSGSEAFSQNTLRHVGSLNHGKIVKGNARHVALFFLKVATLEMVRRLSKAKCPFAWRGLQALQFLCYPPFKWIHRWAPFKGLVKGMQVHSFILTYSLDFFFFFCRNYCVWFNFYFHLDWCSFIIHYIFYLCIFNR